ncbi:MAG: hypothetical protein JW941_06465 [Candidatus Coatesbacteria bacterium]|nr:hypothetical protein [Candidatus Coatesbacteria bacterium]
MSRIGNPQRLPFRVILFALILLTGIAAVGYEILNGQCPMKVDGLLASEMNELASKCGGCPSAQKGTCAAKSAPCAVTESAPNPEDRAVIFILLDNASSETASKAAEMLESLTARLVEANQPVLSMTLRKGERGFDQMIRQFSIKSLPTVVALSQGCKSTVVKTEDIGEDALNRAFANASKDTGCVPTASTPAAPTCSATCHGNLQTPESE